jgi:hypothetical protein
MSMFRPVKRGTTAAKVSSSLLFVYVAGSLVWAWDFNFRAELHKPLVVVYLLIFTVAFLAAATAAALWAWRAPPGDGA